MKATRLFIHGLESSSGGTKGLFFRRHFPDMLIEDYFGSFSQRMVTLKGLLAEKDRILLVGSSFGGLMAAVYACEHEEQTKKIILLAPALHSDYFRPHLKKKSNVPVIIFHGRQDQVVPLEPVRAIAGQVFKNLQFNEVEDDHFLHRTFRTLNWKKLLE
ncbi:MAG: alpha/beta hydrolase [Thermodesulfobacteriota bacterium]